MTAEDLGKSLLAEVEEVGLDEVSLITAAPVTCTDESVDTE